MSMILCAMKEQTCYRGSFKLLFSRAGAKLFVFFINFFYFFVDGVIIT